MCVDCNSGLKFSLCFKCTYYWQGDFFISFFVYVYQLILRIPSLCLTSSKGYQLFFHSNFSLSIMTKLMNFFSFLLSAERTSSDKSFFYSFTYPRIHKMACWSPLLTNKRTGKKWTFYRIRMARNLWDHRRLYYWNTKETLK